MKRLAIIFLALGALTLLGSGCDDKDKGSIVADLLDFSSSATLPATEEQASDLYGVAYDAGLSVLFEAQDLVTPAVVGTCDDSADNMTCEETYTFAGTQVPGSVGGAALVTGSRRDYEEWDMDSYSYESDLDMVVEFLAFEDTEEQMDVVIDGSAAVTYSYSGSESETLTSYTEEEVSSEVTTALLMVEYGGMAAKMDVTYSYDESNNYQDSDDGAETETCSYTESWTIVVYDNDGKVVNTFIYQDSSQACSY